MGAYRGAHTGTAWMTNSTPTPWNLPAFLTATLANAEANAGVGTGQTTAALQSAKEDPRDPTVAAITHSSSAAGWRRIPARRRVR